MTARTFVGVDFSATTVKLAALDAGGRRIAVARLPTAEVSDPRHAADGLARAIGSLVGDRELGGVGVGFCGFVDPVQGRVLETTETLPGWRNVPLRAQLEAALGGPVVLDNDGNAHALGEARSGRRADVSLVAIVLGTGVGGGVVLDGRLHQGTKARAAHLGHLKVRPRGRRCACGGRGCLEAYASAWACRDQLGRDPERVFAAARAGEVRATRWVRAAAWAIGRAAGDIANLLCPERIVVGGGLAEGWPQLAEGAQASFEAAALQQVRQVCRLVRSRAGTWVGAVGAAHFVFPSNKDLC